MAAFSILAIAVASGKAGYVYLRDGKVQDWGLTVKAARTSEELTTFVQDLITRLRPDAVATEDCRTGCRKGAAAKRLIEAIAELASKNPVLDVSVARPRTYPSKYEEAQALADRHPEIAGHLPAHKRRIYEFEPRSMLLFEALALAETALNGPTAQLAVAVG